MRDVYYAKSLHGDSDSDEQKKIQEEAALAAREAISKETQKRKWAKSKAGQRQERTEGVSKKKARCNGDNGQLFYFHVTRACFISVVNVSESISANNFGNKWKGHQAASIQQTPVGEM